MLEGNRPGGKGFMPVIRNMRLSTAGIIVLALTAAALAVLAFTQGGNVNIAPGLISFYMVLSGALFAICAVLALQRPDLASRLFGMLCVALALVLVIISIIFFRIVTPAVSP